MKERSTRFMTYDQYIRNTQYKIDRLFTEYDEIDMNMNILAINNNHMMLNEGYSPDDIYYGNIDYVVEATEEKKGIIGKIIDGIKKIIHTIVAKVKDLFSNRSKIDPKTPVEVPKGLLNRNDRLKKLGPVVLKGLAAVGAVGAIAASAKYAHGKMKKDGDKIVYVPNFELVGGTPEPVRRTSRDKSVPDNKQLPAIVKPAGVPAVKKGTDLATVHQDPNFTFADGKMPTPAPKGHYRPNFTMKDSLTNHYPPTVRKDQSPQVVEPFKQADLKAIENCNNALSIELDRAKKSTELSDTSKITLDAGKLIAFISTATDELTKCEKALDRLDPKNPINHPDCINMIKAALSNINNYISEVNTTIAKFCGILDLYIQTGDKTAEMIKQHSSMKAMHDQQARTNAKMITRNLQYNDKD